MTRKIDLFMIGVLFLNITLNGFPQVINVRYAARYDAEADAAANTDKTTWFMLGMLAPAACVAGYAIGTMINPEPPPGYFGYSLTPVDANDAQCNSAVIGFAVGCLTLPLAIGFSFKHPPPERLLGKSPEYIQAYTDTYKSQTLLLRSRSAAGGLALGTITGCLLLYADSQD